MSLLLADSYFNDEERVMVSSLTKGDDISNAIKLADTTPKLHAQIMTPSFWPLAFEAGKFDMRISVTVGYLENYTINDASHDVPRHGREAHLIGHTLIHGQWCGVGSENSSKNTFMPPKEGKALGFDPSADPLTLWVGNYEFRTHLELSKVPTT
ncbi:MAG: hypothetical protein AAGF10_07480 [Verrucomicrobiota bacterium]